MSGLYLGIGSKVLLLTVSFFKLTIIIIMIVLNRQFKLSIRLLYSSIDCLNKGIIERERERDRERERQRQRERVR